MSPVSRFFVAICKFSQWWTATPDCSLSYSDHYLMIHKHGGQWWYRFFKAVFYCRKKSCFLYHWHNGCISSVHIIAIFYHGVGLCWYRRVGLGERSWLGCSILSAIQCIAKLCALFTDVGGMEVHVLVGVFHDSIGGFVADDFESLEADFLQVAKAACDTKGAHTRRLSLSTVSLLKASLPKCIWCNKHIKGTNVTTL